MKNANRKRKHTVSIRMNDDEYNQLNMLLKQSGCTLQTYVLNAVLNKKIITKEELNHKKEKDIMFKDLIRQLNGIGNNINQMTRTANMINALPSINVLLNITHQINDIKKIVDAEWQSYKKDTQ